MGFERLFPKRPITDEQPPFTRERTGPQVEPTKTFIVNLEDFMPGSQAGRDGLPPLTGYLTDENVVDPHHSHSD